MTFQLTSTDAMHSVINQITADGQCQRQSFSAYGGSATALASTPGFNGERRDPLTKTTHLGNGYRAYNPILMRFHAPDSMSPFGAGGINCYAYCNGDPINNSDPSGHMSAQAGVGIGLGVLGMILGIAVPGASIAAIVGVAAIATGIASGATENSDPETSAALGWVSMAGGLVGAAIGLTQVGIRVGAAMSNSVKGRMSLSMNGPQLARITKKESWLPNFKGALVSLREQKTTTSLNIMNLPNEMLDEIILQMPLDDVESLSKVNKRFNGIIDRGRESSYKKITSIPTVASEYFYSLSDERQAVILSHYQSNLYNCKNYKDFFACRSIHEQLISHYYSTVDNYADISMVIENDVWQSFHPDSNFFNT